MESLVLYIHTLAKICPLEYLDRNALIKILTEPIDAIT